MAGYAYFSPSNITTVEGLNSLEVWIERICNQKNISNSYFGTILVATSDLYNLLLALDPQWSPAVYCSSQRGAFLIGFEAPNNFLDVAALVQKDLGDIVRQPEMNFYEACIVNVRTCADAVQLDEQRHAIELIFYLKSINPYQTQLRRKLVDGYIEGVCAPKIIN